MSTRSTWQEDPERPGTYLAPEPIAIQPGDSVATFFEVGEDGAHPLSIEVEHVPAAEVRHFRIADRPLSAEDREYLGVHALYDSGEG